MTDGLQIFDVPADAEGDETPDGPAEHAARRRPRWPGSLAGGIAILMVVTWGVALLCSLGDMFELAVGLSISAVLLSALAVVAGIIAVVGRWGRGWGIAAIVVGLLLNPVVLLYGLTWIGAL
ncbi:hypothetical protein H4J02_12555 [Protaetiibacter sp. SSC-01]|uniref:hypothetical protein n=1 Tax=Protaetiibacter sp. SSC-01 TaxID=2759943 RepID=UPI001656F23E|nr:hypothetical protein [Protaetiibacter sp. SSC-01]QNO37256.1 hypothetical protein H4J02_12555 [Protaetiibacter sp. SSC-01]